MKSYCYKSSSHVQNEWNECVHNSWSSKFVWNVRSAMGPNLALAAVIHHSHAIKHIPLLKIIVHIVRFLEREKILNCWPISIVIEIRWNRELDFFEVCSCSLYLKQWIFHSAIHWGIHTNKHKKEIHWQSVMGEMFFFEMNEILKDS